MIRMVLVAMLMCLFAQSAEACGRLKARRAARQQSYGCQGVSTNCCGAATGYVIQQQQVAPVPVIQQIEGLLPQPQRARLNPEAVPAPARQTNEPPIAPLPRKQQD